VEGLYRIALSKELVVQEEAVTLQITQSETTEQQTQAAAAAVEVRFQQLLTQVVTAVLV
jgi:hypothetical protein